jgi:uncharacterized protein (TIGR02452 family)
MSEHFDINKIFEDNKKRVDVWNETHNINLSLTNIPRSIKYFVNNNISKTTNKTNKTNIIVVNMDSLDCAIMHHNSVVLNMADDLNPGGMVTTGSQAQEEEIFRRSNIELGLSYKTLYPILKNELIYTSNVAIYRNSAEYDYTMKNNTTYISVITCPAIRHPKIINGKLNEQDTIIMSDKIKLILQTGYKHNHDTIILGAHGCGAWRCPPENIANLYKHAIEQYSCFDNIYFAILGDNFKIFKEVFYT